MLLLNNILVEIFKRKRSVLYINRMGTRTITLAKFYLIGKMPPGLFVTS